VGAAAAVAPSLSGDRAARLLHHAFVLSSAGFAGKPLCTALAQRILATYCELSPKSTAKALQACGRLGICDDWLTNGLATRALARPVLEAMTCRDIASASDGIACLQVRLRGQKTLVALLDELVKRLNGSHQLTRRLPRSRPALILFLEAASRLRRVLPDALLAAISRSLLRKRRGGGCARPQSLLDGMAASSLARLAWSICGVCGAGGGAPGRAHTALLTAGDIVSAGVAACCAKEEEEGAEEDAEEEERL
jgi:hypothetical protein